MTSKEAMMKFLTDLGCRKMRGYNSQAEWWILDKFDTNLYLGFDLTDNTEKPESIGSVDVFACKPGEHVQESSERIQLLSDVRQSRILRLLFALGANRFSEATRTFLYSSARILRSE